MCSSFQFTAGTATPSFYSQRVDGVEPGCPDCGQEGSSDDSDGEEGWDSSEGCEVRGRDLKQHLHQKAARQECADNSEGQTNRQLHQSQSKDEPHDISAVCAERHSDTDFLRTLADGICRHRVDPYDGEQQTDQSKSREHRRQNSWLTHLILAEPAQCGDVKQRKIRIHFLNFCSKNSRGLVLGRSRSGKNPEVRQRHLTEWHID